MLSRLTYFFRSQNRIIIIINTVSFVSGLEKIVPGVCRLEVRQYFSACSDLYVDRLQGVLG